MSWVCTLGITQLHPASTSADCSLMAAGTALSSAQLLSARGNCCEPAGVAQRPSTHCRGRSSPAAFTSWRCVHLTCSLHLRAASWRPAGSSLLGGCTEALVLTQPHPALAGSSLLLPSSRTRPWLSAERFPFPSAPAKAGRNPA